MEQKAFIIGEETVRKFLTVDDVIDICEKTWRWYGEGKVVMPNKITTDMSGLGVAGWFNSMPAYIAPMDTAYPFLEGFNPSYKHLCKCWS